MPQASEHHPVYMVHVARRYGDWTGNVTVHLSQPHEVVKAGDRKPDTIYSDDFAPKTTEHHVTLGAFLDSWGRLEISVSYLLSTVLRVDLYTGNVVFRSASTRQVSDMIITLATIRLDDEIIRQLVNLKERLSQLASKRNTLVHGQWVVEIVVWGHKGVAKHTGRLLRYKEPDDYRIRPLLSDIKNQRERISHTFDLKRIEAATRDADTLLRDVTAFTSVIAPLMANPPRSGQQEK